MNWQSTVSRESATCPGVRFTVRRLSEGMRVEIRLRCAAALAELRDIEAEREAWFEELAAARGVPIDSLKVGDLTPAERRRLQGFADRIDLLQAAQIEPAYFDAGFVSVDGLEIDGRVPDGPTLRNAGPPALYREIVAEIMRLANVGHDDAENLESPSTSGAEVDGGTQPTTAPSAGGTDCTNPATAASISQSS